MTASASAPASDIRRQALDLAKPEPQSQRWNDQPGTVLWAQPLPAGATQRFSAEHVITWPKDARLRERP